MKRFKICIINTALIALVTSGGLVFGNPARQDTVIRYSSIPNFSFVPPNDAVGFHRTRGGLSAHAYDLYFYASVNIPDSAQVIEMRAYVRDDTAGPNIEVTLWRVPHTVFPTEIMAQVTSSAVSPNIQELIDSTIDYSMIDNTSYFYHVEASLPQEPDLTLLGVLITYKVVEGTRVEETPEFVNTSSASPVVHPTPFVQQTAIDYTVPKRERVSIKIYDEVGRLVRTMIDSTMDAGSYTARWDGRDENGKRLPNGSYFCIIKTNGASTTKTVRID